MDRLGRWVLWWSILLAVTLGSCFPPAAPPPTAGPRTHETVVRLTTDNYTNAALRLGRVIYASDEINVSTLAGSGRIGPLGGGYRDGAALQAEFHEPSGVEAGPNGSVYVSDWVNQRIRIITPGGDVITWAGSGQPGPRGGMKDGPRLDAAFDGPEGLALLRDGSLVVADSRNHRLRHIVTEGLVETLAGGGPAGFLGDFVDGPAAQARFCWPLDVVADSDGRLAVADFNNHAIRLVVGDHVQTLAGSGLPGTADGHGADAGLWTPNRLALAADGSLIVTEGSGFYGGGGHRVRRVGPNGDVTTVAGTGERGYRDGPAEQALFNIPQGVATDGTGAIYVADSGNHVIRRIDPNGMVWTVAGTGEPGYRDGPGKEAQFWYPSDLAFLPDGRLVVADRLTQRVRLLDGLLGP